MCSTFVYFLVFEIKANGKIALLKIVLNMAVLSISIVKKIIQQSQYKATSLISNRTNIVKVPYSRDLDRVTLDIF